MNALLDTFKSLGLARVALIAAVGAATLGFFVYFAGNLTQPKMSLLYSELDQSDSAAIVSHLEAAGVPFELSPDGRRIMAPTDQVARMRLSMAEAGIPNGGSVGYEIFDQSGELGSSSFVQNINHLRALEGELARTIRSLGNIQNARVHLVLPQRELFSRERNEPSASVVIRLVGGSRLTKSQSAALQQLVAAAVPRMEADRVSIIDHRGRLLARTTTGDDVADLANDAEEMRLSVEQRLSQSVEDLLERTLGTGNVRVTVSAELDFDRVTESSETYDPDGQVVRSTQTIEESEQDQDGEGQDPVTVGNNLPNNDLPQLGGGPTSSSTASRIEETVNYEISKTVRSHVRESGAIRRLSVAVLVNGNYAADENDELIYSPRSEEELLQIEELVKSAVGYDEARGDLVEIANMQFADLSNMRTTLPTSDMILGLEKQELMRLAELLVLGLVAALVLLLVVKPLLSRLLEPVPALAGDVGGALADEVSGRHALEDKRAPGGGLPALGAAGQDTALAEAGGSSLPPYEEEPDDAGLEQLIDVQKVEGRVRASSLRKIGEIIDKHPEEAVSILRNWIHQEI